MASRYFDEFRKIGKPGPTPAMGQRGTPGAEAAKTTVRERTSNWPDPQPHWTGSFNRKTKAHVVKTTAKRAGLDA